MFRERFAGYEDRYVLIGGTASLLAMRSAGLPFRATKDLDMVLCIEALDGRFVETFWAFVREGGYARRERAQGPRRYYRFHKPVNESYPAMIELFSASPTPWSCQKGRISLPSRSRQRRPAFRPSSWMTSITAG